MQGKERKDSQIGGALPQDWWGHAPPDPPPQWWGHAPPNPPPDGWCPTTRMVDPSTTRLVVPHHQIGGTMHHQFGGDMHHPVGSARGRGERDSEDRRVGKWFTDSATPSLPFFSPPCHAMPCQARPCHRLMHILLKCSSILECCRVSCSCSCLVLCTPPIAISYPGAFPVGSPVSWQSRDGSPPHLLIWHHLTSYSPEASNAITEQEAPMQLYSHDTTVVLVKLSPVI